MKPFATLLCAFAIGSVAAAEPPSLATLAAGQRFAEARLSPDGKHIAVVRRDERVSTLLIVDTATLKPTTELAFPRYEHVIRVDWANEEMLVVAKGTGTGSLGGPRITGELISVSVDGSKNNYLMGYRADQSKRNRGRVADRSIGWMVDDLPDNRDEVLVADYDWSPEKHIDFRARLQRIDVYSGARTLITKSPLPQASFSTDRSGAVRFAHGYDDDMRLVTWRYDNTGDTWQKIDAGLGEHGFLRPLGFTADPDVFYALVSRNGEAGCVYRVTASTLERSRVTCDERIEPEYLMPSSVRGAPLGAFYNTGVPTLHLFDGKSADATLYRELSKQFAPGFVRFIDSSDDGKQLLFDTWSDRDGGRIFLLDTTAGHARQLFRRIADIEPEQLGATGAFEFDARDGTKIGGLLTVPPDRPRNGLPMVVIPHGGPYGVKDTWGYDADAQVLATRGYAVLKVNFRGSDGYGESFQRLGYRQWGGTIQDDIADATRWVIAQGLVDPQRICIYGGSFGAYSALMSAIREPELFRCAIGYAGVYDLDLMFDAGDVRRTERGRRYLDTVLGGDEAERAKQSPVAQIENLQAPVLLVHGAADVRAPLTHAKALRDALERHDRPHEWFVVQDEAHGFFRAKNREALYARMLTFLDAHIGAKAAAATQ